MRNQHPKVVGFGGTLREGSTSLGALRRAIAAAEAAGAEVDILDLRELALPMYEPGKPLEAYEKDVGRFVEALRGADALLISTAAYHGTLAGVTKNALDFVQALSRDERPYLYGRVVGLISTAGGTQAASNANTAMMHAVHALRGIVAPLMISIPQAWRVTDENGDIEDDAFGNGLDRLGALVVELGGKLSRTAEAIEPAA